MEKKEGERGGAKGGQSLGECVGIENKM